MRKMGPKVPNYLKTVVQKYHKYFSIFPNFHDPHFGGMFRSKSTFPPVKNNIFKPVFMIFWPFLPQNWTKNWVIP